MKKLYILLNLPLYSLCVYSFTEQIQDYTQVKKSQEDAFEYKIITVLIYPIKIFNHWDYQNII